MGGEGQGQDRNLVLQISCLFDDNADVAPSVNSEIT